MLKVVEREGRGGNDGFSQRFQSPCTSEFRLQTTSLGKKTHNYWHIASADIQPALVLSLLSWKLIDELVQEWGESCLWPEPNVLYVQWSFIQGRLSLYLSNTACAGFNDVVSVFQFYEMNVFHWSPCKCVVGWDSWTIQLRFLTETNWI